MSRKSASTEPSPATTDEQVRNYWRSVIAHTCMHLAGLCRIVDVGMTDIRKLPSHVYPIAVPKCHALLDELCLAERTRGARRHEDEQYVNAQLWNLLSAYKLGPKPAPSVGESCALDLESRST